MLYPSYNVQDLKYLHVISLKPTNRMALAPRPPTNPFAIYDTCPTGTRYEMKAEPDIPSALANGQQNINYEKEVIYIRKSGSLRVTISDGRFFATSENEISKEERERRQAMWALLELNKAPIQPQQPPRGHTNAHEPGESAVTPIERDVESPTSDNDDVEEETQQAAQTLISIFQNPINFKYPPQGPSKDHISNDNYESSHDSPASSAIKAADARGDAPKKRKCSQSVNGSKLADGDDLTPPPSRRRSDDSPTRPPGNSQNGGITDVPSPPFSPSDASTQASEEPDTVADNPAVAHGQRSHASWAADFKRGQSTDLGLEQGKFQQTTIKGKKPLVLRNPNEPSIAAAMYTILARVPGGKMTRPSLDKTLMEWLPDVASNKRQSFRRALTQERSLAAERARVGGRDMWIWRILGVDEMRPKDDPATKARNKEKARRKQAREV